MATEDQVIRATSLVLGYSQDPDNFCAGCVLSGNCGDVFSVNGRTRLAAEKHHGVMCDTPGPTGAMNRVWVLREVK